MDSEVLTYEQQIELFSLQAEAAREETKKIEAEQEKLRLEIENNTLLLKLKHSVQNENLLQAMSENNELIRSKEKTAKLYVIMIAILFGFMILLSSLMSIWNIHRLAEAFENLNVTSSYTNDNSIIENNRTTVNEVDKIENSFNKVTNDNPVKQ